MTAPSTRLPPKLSTSLTIIDHSLVSYSLVFLPYAFACICCDFLPSLSSVFSPFSSSNIPKDLSTLCCLAVLSVLKSAAYCCSVRSCLLWSSRRALCSWSARVFRISKRSSCLSARFSILIFCVCSSRHCTASCETDSIKINHKVQMSFRITQVVKCWTSWQYAHTVPKVNYNCVVLMDREILMKQWCT